MRLKKFKSTVGATTQTAMIVAGIVLLVLIIGVGTFLYFHSQNTNGDETKKTNNTSSFTNTMATNTTLENKNAGSIINTGVSLSDITATQLSKVGPTKNAYWARQLELVWNDIEPEQGTYDWNFMDSSVQGAEKAGVYPLIIVKPFANWDQKKCHPEDKYNSDMPDKNSTDPYLKVGTPCDMSAYTSFLKKAIERYDGDGTDDMPNLIWPIKYWEIMNEPIMQGGSTGGAGEELKFFVGTSQDYLSILKASYTTIKAADPSAYVLHAGMAGMQQEVKDFWGPIYKEAGQYFDIANIHSISTDDQREDLYMTKFNNFLKKYGNEDKPVWITEDQIGPLMEKPDNVKDIDTLLAKSTIVSLAMGADKLFYIDNWRMWNQEMPTDKKGGPFDVFTDTSGAWLNSSTQKTYVNLVNTFNGFTKLDVIKQETKDSMEENGGTIVTVGQYKFTTKNGTMYVFWGNGTLPDEISDSASLQVSDIYGQKHNSTKAELQKSLSESPVFVTVAQ